jgi:nitrate reductase alpha subunit
MSHFLDRLTHFAQPKESFSGDLGRTTGEDRTWEDAYRNRWAHDKIVRSTHGVNCTGSCSCAGVPAAPATAGTCTAPTA